MGAPTCADDTCLLTTKHIGAQTAMYIAQNNANNERYEFSTTKTKIMLCNSNIKAEEANNIMPLEMNGQQIDYSEQEKHLHVGLERTTDGKAKKNS